MQKRKTKRKKHKVKKQKYHLTSSIVWCRRFVFCIHQHNTGPSGQSIPAQVSQTADGVFKAEFVPRSVGEHKVSVTVNGSATTGSPYAAKVSFIHTQKIKIN